MIALRQHGGGALGIWLLDEARDLVHALGTDFAHLNVTVSGLWRIRRDSESDEPAFAHQWQRSGNCGVEGAVRAGKHVTPDPQAFAASPSESIDYAIMEHEALVACVPVDMGWSDVGSWDALHAISAKDAGGNAVRGNALPIGVNNCLIHTDGPRVTLVDVNDLIVVVSQGEVMILRRGDSQKVRKVTEAIRDAAVLQAAE
jgi:hypothetical protein